VLSVLLLVNVIVGDQKFQIESDEPQGTSQWLQHGSMTSNPVMVEWSMEKQSQMKDGRKGGKDGM
jgi:hypothetical protein